MKQFGRLIAGTRYRLGDRSGSYAARGSQAPHSLRQPLIPRRALLLISAAGAFGLVSLLSARSLAQRVQFPTPTQPVQTTTPLASPPPSTYAPPSEFGAPVTSAPSAIAPPPTYSPSAVGPPPVFDPYSAGSSLAPPPAVPYNYTPPPPASAYPQQPVPLFPDGAPIQYQPAPYDFATSTEGYWAKTQRFLQELSVEYTYLYGDHADPDDFEVNRVELSSTFAFPMFYNIETPLLVTPGFAFNFFEGPISGPPIPGPPLMAGGPDLPEQVYDAYLDFAWYPRCYEWIGGELGFRTGVWSDFHHVSSDSIRLLGRALASVSMTPNLDVLFGAVYLDRVDVKLLPAGGFYYRPTPEWDMYLVFPNPKVRKYVANIGNSKWYWFAAGEYGGGSWTVRRQTTDDQIDYNDIRVSGGLEWETQTFIRGHIEVGYVWDREIVFASGDPPRFKPDDTIMIRAGVDF